MRKAKWLERLEAGLLWVWLVSVVVGIVVAMWGCAGLPKNWERGWLDATTNVVEVVGYRGVTNDAGEVALVPFTNVVESWSYAPGTNTVLARRVAQGVGGWLGPWGEIAGVVLGGAFALWAQLRSRRAVLTSEVLAQVIETGRLALRSTAEGAQLEAKWTEWMKAHQEESGVIEDVVRLLGHSVRTEEALEVAQRLILLMRGEGPMPPSRR